MPSKKTKYAIKALALLGKDPAGPPMHITDIAKQENIPEKYLGAILGELRNAELIFSK